MAAAGNQERRIVAQPDEATIHSLEAAARADASALTPTGIARVGDLFVREDDRNRGIGSALLTTIPTAADERGYERLVLRLLPQDAEPDPRERSSSRRRWPAGRAASTAPRPTSAASCSRSTRKA
jgi:GNAT superfamily N-acetyltransferase